jgi:hypothetical protein
MYMTCSNMSIVALRVFMHDNPYRHHHPPLLGDGFEASYLGVSPYLVDGQIEVFYP